MAGFFVGKGRFLATFSPLCRRSSSLSVVGLSHGSSVPLINPAARSVLLLGSVSGPPRTALFCRGFSDRSIDDIEVWSNAKELLKENKIEDAVQTIESGLQEFNKSELLISRLADLYMATSQFDKVIEVCDRALELGGGDRYEFLAMQGEAYDRLKNFDQARPKYEEVLQHNPNNSLITQRLAYLLLHSTDWLSNSAEYQPVVAAFDRSLQLTPDDPENHYGRGLAFFHGRQFEEAIESFTKATELDPKYAPGWQKMALAHMVRQEFKPAIYAADQFFETAKDYYSKLAVDLTFGMDSIIFDLMLKRAVCYLMIEDYRMVIGCVEVLLEAGKDIPQNVKTEALSLQAEAHYREGGFWESVKCATECIKEDEGCYPAYKIRSDAYAALGRSSSAEEDREMCMRLASKNQFPA